MSSDISVYGEKIIRVLHALSSALKLYETNNTAVVRQIDEMDAALKEYMSNNSEDLRITLRPDEFFVNDRLLKVDLALYLRARDVALILEPLEYGDIRFSKECNRSHVEALVNDLSSSIRANVSNMKPDYGAITGKKAVGSSAAAFRFEPDRLAIWLYSGLLDVTEQLYSQREKIPSLLPIKRSIQLIIDNMKNHNGIYQMLSAFRDPETERSRAATQVAIAIDVIGFGLFSGLKGTELMNLALTSVLGGLEQSADPLKAVSPLFGFSGLGTSANEVILTLFDSRAARFGKRASPAARLLMVVEAYHRCLDEEREESLPQHIFNLASGEIKGVDKGIAQFFARYKGPFPIGSFVRLSGERGEERGVVVGHADNELGKQKPMVMLLKKENRLGPTVNLVSDSSRQISEALSVCKEGLRLVEL